MDEKKSPHFALFTSRSLGGILLRINRSMNAIVAQLKNCPFGFNTSIDLKNTTTTFTSDIAGIIVS